MSIDRVQASASKSPLPDVMSRPASAQPSASTKPVRAAQDPSATLPQARQVEIKTAFGAGLLVVYRIMDKKTGDLILQIPPQQCLEMAQRSRQSLQTDSKASEKLDIRS